jgi:hypothetical protein
MRHIDSKGKQAKMKSPIQLQELLEVTTAELAKMESGVPEELVIETDDVSSISSKAAGEGALAAAVATLQLQHPNLIPVVTLSWPSCALVT